MKAWHFVNNTLRDGSPIPEDGEWLVHDGPLKMCQSGLHASARLIDALQYAPGNTLCRVEVRGEIIHGDDKLVAAERKILWRIDAEEFLREAGRKFALDVIHLWDAPPVVREFLETGNQDFRQAAAGAATWDAAEAAAGAAAGAAARADAGAAARDAGTAAEAAWAAAWTAAAWDASASQERILLSLLEDRGLEI